MSRGDLTRRVKIAVAVYAAWIMCGVSTFIFDNVFNASEKTLLTPGGHLHQYQWFEFYTGLTPFVVLLPAVWLAWCMQRRISFVRNLQACWPNLVDTVHCAIEYLRRPDGDPEEYERVLTLMRARIDDTQALFCRSDPTEAPSGNTPFDGMTHIHHLFQSLDIHEFVPEDETRQVRAEIIKTWQKTRGQILREFDRAELR